jgi:cell pole-organizing protein PopZ
MAEATANQEGEQDPSMEEILQSIRRIIAEDGESPAPTPSESKNPPKISGDAQASDVLELTEMVKDDGTIESLKPSSGTDGNTAPAVPVIQSAPPVAAESTPPAAPPALATTDVLSQIEEALAVPETTPAAATTPPAATTPVATTPVATPAPVSAQPASGETLLSDQAVATATSSIKKLQAATEPPLPPGTTTPSPVFQSGNTVEAMVAAMLKPMIKEWLDANLPKIVERMVAQEIRRLTK